MKTFYEDQDLSHRIHLPLPVGYWCIGGDPGLRVPLYKKPAWTTRQFSRWLLEWRWEDRRNEG